MSNENTSDLFHSLYQDLFFMYSIIPFFEQLAAFNGNELRDFNSTIFFLFFSTDKMGKYECVDH